MLLSVLKKAKGIFIDGIEGFKSATDYPERIGEYLAAITNELRSCGVTATFFDETDLYNSEVVIPVKEPATVIENVVVLRYVELRSRLFRLISIMKARESVCDSTIRQFVITPKGLKVESSFESTESILSGNARTTIASHSSKYKKLKSKHHSSSA